MGVEWTCMARARHRMPFRVCHLVEVELADVAHVHAQGIEKDDGGYGAEQRDDEHHGQVSDAVLCAAPFPVAPDLERRVHGRKAVGGREHAVGSRTVATSRGPRTTPHPPTCRHRFSTPWTSSEHGALRKGRGVRMARHYSCARTVAPWYRRAAPVLALFCLRTYTCVHVRRSSGEGGGDVV